MLSLITVCCNDDKEAHRIVSELLKKKLIATAQVFPASTKYELDASGSIVKLSEVIFEARSRTNLVPDAIAVIEKLHGNVNPDVSVRSLQAGEANKYVRQVSGISESEVASSSSAVAEEAPKPHQVESPPLNEDIVNEANGLSLQKQYMASLPFPKMRFKNLFSDDLVQDVFDVLATQGNFEPRSNDLYLFSQSEDLRVIGERAPDMDKLAKYLYCPAMLKFLSALTGIKLNNQVDMSATLYTKGCHLLTHDDRMNTRRLAFILYLTPRGWSEHDGGHLRFFFPDPTRENMPDPHRYEQWLPEWNTFAVFTVGPHSFHTVCEVTSDMPRVAVSGWFHGEALKEPQLKPFLYPKAPLAMPKVSAQKSLFQRSVSTMYQTPMLELTKKMRKKGAVMLSSFLQPECVQPNVLRLHDCEWEDCGPLHIRYYQRCRLAKGLLADVQSLLASAEMLEYLKNLVGSQLKVRSVETRRFIRGHHYTLLYDDFDGERKKVENENGKVEVCFCLTNNTKPDAEEEWDTDFGGYLCYIDSGDGEELLTVFPESNSMTVTLIEPGVQSFVKYLSTYAPSDRYDVLLTLDVGEPIESLQMEVSEDDDDEEEEEEEEEDGDDEEPDEEEPEEEEPEEEGKQVGKREKELSQLKSLKERAKRRKY